MDPHRASCWGRKCSSARGPERTHEFSPIRGPGRWAAGLLPIGVSFVALVAVATPATGAPSRSATTEVADTGELPEASPDQGGVLTPGTAPGRAPTSSPEGSAPQLAESEPNSTADAPDTAQTGAVSPAIAHGDVVDSDGIAAEPAGGSAANAVDDVSTAAASNGPAVSTITRATTPVAVKARHLTPPKGWRYRSNQEQYRSHESIAHNTARNAEISEREVSSDSSQIDGSIPRTICAQISCQSGVGNPPDSPPAAEVTERAALVAEMDPGDEGLISRLLGRIGPDDDACGNRNISFRVSSPGDDGRVSQTAASGDCGRNTNVSIRINSPGDNGPVTQGVGTVSWLGRLSALVRASMRTRVRLAQANQPPVRVDPAIFGRRIERNARRLAWSLVAQAQARAKKQVRRAGASKRMRPQAVPRATRERSRSSAHVSASGVAVTSVAGANGAGARVSVSARVSIKTAQRTRSSRRKTRPTSLTAPALQQQRLAAGPQLRPPEARSAGGSDSTRTAILLALLAAAVASYLLVPPLRPARGFSSSVLRWPRRGAPPR
jgi:hypothetical protein